MNFKDAVSRIIESEMDYWTIAAYVDFREDEISNTILESDGDTYVKLAPEPSILDIYALVRERDIDTGSIAPLSQRESPDENKSGFLFRIRKEAKVIFHYKGKEHKFSLNSKTPRVFPSLESLREIEGAETSPTRNCPTRIILWQLRCCGHNMLLERNYYGILACNQGVNNRRCCR